jgi:hypothetical protein
MFDICNSNSLDDVSNQTRVDTRDITQISNDTVTLEGDNTSDNTSHLSKRSRVKKELLEVTRHRRCETLTPSMVVRLVPQAGLETSSLGNEMSEQNIQFHDETPSHKLEVESIMDPTRSLRDSYDAPLGQFFQRPIKIAEYNWSTSTILTGDFDPWLLYLTNKRVVNRMTNHYLLRAKLHLKFVVNGNGFHYGRVMACYLPLANYDQATQVSTLVAGPSVQLSQCPKIFLNPTTNGGGELTLPFFWHQDYLKLTSDIYENMGKIYLRDLTGLKHANGATDVCNISIFAWMEDVSLSGLTSAPMENLVPQSGTETDEANAKGTISGPATAIAAAASNLSDIPVIGPYARATAKAASFIAGSAKLLGYSRPLVTRDPEPYKPRPISNMATTTVPDGALKLTVDDKQELTIDPAISGIGRADPLDILSIAKRESWLTNFVWPENTGSEVLLWNARVNPGLYHEAVPGTKYLPAMAATIQPFEYWTGTIKFRFQIVCSAYHKGRIKIVFDPHTLGLTPEYNVNYVKVVDIAECSDFTVSIPAAQPNTFLTCPSVCTTSASEGWSATRFTTTDDVYSTGVIGVYVVNDLTTPNSTVNNDIQINVFVSAGDDFEVAVPRDIFANLVFKPQAGIETDAICADGLDEPESQNSDPINDVTQDLSDIGHVYFGERIRSFRPLLKRYALHESVTNLGASTPRIFAKRCMFPHYRGNVPGAVNTTAAAAPYSYANTLLLHYVTMMHQGWRGSIRYKILPFNFAIIQGFTAHIERDMADMSANMHQTNNLTNETALTLDEAAETTVSRLSKDTFPRYKSPPLFDSGGAYALSEVNPTIEYEIPFYSKNRFFPGKRLDYTTAPAVGAAPLSVARILLTMQTAASSSGCFNVFVAAGEDFQPYFFTGMPPLFYEALPPAPNIV